MITTSSDNAPPNILVVDDTPANLHLLVSLLSERGYKVRPVSSGELALRAVNASSPDLVLLDIAMPGMDGFEVCRRLKEDERTRDIPVIFISAHAESEDKLRGFEAGGVDYVSKPFQVEEVLARVNAHVTIRKQQLRLEQNYRQLRELERMRDTLTHMVAHDMRSPLLALNLGLDYITLELPKGKKPLDEMVATARISVKSLIGMVTEMLVVSRLESGTMQLDLVPFDLTELAGRIVRDFRPLAGNRTLSLKAAGPLTITADLEIVSRVLSNLIGNAIKFTPAAGTISVTVAPQGGRTRVEVTDTGPGIDSAYHERIFEKFGQVESPGARKGYGLGLAFARMAIEAHGGTIGVISAVNQGSRFWFML